MLFYYDTQPIKLGKYICFNKYHKSLGNASTNIGNEILLKLIDLALERQYGKKIITNNEYCVAIDCLNSSSEHRLNAIFCVQYLN